MLNVWNLLSNTNLGIEGDTKILNLIGITGGIGAGKSIVCKLFSLYGIKIYNADYFAKYLMENNAQLIQNIKNTFDNDIYTNEKLNRNKLAEIVFNNNTKLKQLNELVHPVVGKHSLIWMEKQTGPYVLKEAALLFETGSYKQLDYNILVTAPENIRTERVIKRDNTNARNVKKRMDNQLPDIEKKALSDFIIINDDNIAIIPQVNKINKKLFELSRA